MSFMAFIVGKPHNIKTSVNDYDITSGGISADFGIPGESIACFPSVTTSFTSSTFFFLPRVPNLFQKVSS